MTSRTPDWMLERIALGELPSDERARARARLAREPEGEARLAALAADNARILALRPPDAVAREIQVQLAREELIRPPRSIRPLWTVVAMVAALGVFLLIMGRAGDEPYRPRDTPERRQAGGVPRLEVVREDARVLRSVRDQLAGIAAGRGGDIRIGGDDSMDLFRERHMFAAITG